MSQLNVQFGFLADRAQIENGKLYVIGGGVTLLWREVFPAGMMVSVVACMDYHPSEVGQRRQIRMQISDADGELMAPPFDAHFEPSPRPPGIPRGAPLQNYVAVDVGNAPILPGPGTYAVDFLIDGNHVLALPFVAVEAPRPPQF